MSPEAVDSRPHPPRSPASLAGLTLHHPYVVVDPTPYPGAGPVDQLAPPLGDAAGSTAVASTTPCTAGAVSTGYLFDATTGSFLYELHRAGGCSGTSSWAGRRSARSRACDMA